MSESATMFKREPRFDAQLLELREEDGWQQKNGAWWIAPQMLDARAMARLMVPVARLMTVASRVCDGGETHLDYHWDLNGVILTFSAQTSENKFASISDLCPAADWVEREIHEYFAVDFTGRDNTKPLMLRPGLEAGLNRTQDGKL